MNPDAERIRPIRNKTEKELKLIRAFSPIPTVAKMKNAARSITVYAQAFKNIFFITFIKSTPTKKFYNI